MRSSLRRQSQSPIRRVSQSRGRSRERRQFRRTESWKSYDDSPRSRSRSGGSSVYSDNNSVSSSGSSWDSSRDDSRDSSRRTSRSVSECRYQTTMKCCKGRPRSLCRCSSTSPCRCGTGRMWQRRRSLSWYRGRERSESRCRSCRCRSCTCCSFCVRRLSARCFHKSTSGCNCRSISRSNSRCGCRNSSCKCPAEYFHCRYAKKCFAHAVERCLCSPSSLCAERTLNRASSRESRDTDGYSSDSDDEDHLWRRSRTRSHSPVDDYRLNGYRRFRGRGSFRSRSPTRNMYSGRFSPHYGYSRSRYRSRSPITDSSSEESDF